MLYGVAIGVLRVAPIDKEAPSNIVPVDGCSNLALVAAWRTAMDAKKTAAPPTATIYNYVATGSNAIKNKDFTNAAEGVRLDFPLEQSIWYPFLHTTTFIWLYKLATIFYHLLPGFLIDVALRVRGQKPKMVRIYGKIHKNIDVLQNFLTESWTFETPNVDRLRQSMSAVDQQLFDFDLNGLNWKEYFYRAFMGMRAYLAEEPPTEESLKRGRLILKRFV